MLFLFLLVVICLLSIPDKINVRVELLACDVWEAEDDKIGFFSAVVDNLDQLFL